ncbi:MAG TPA: hypothetical protein VF586_21825 [Pyrinomonadaceae bacterium]|jgi:hypothetical protein
MSGRRKTEDENGAAGNRAAHGAGPGASRRRFTKAVAAALIAAPALAPRAQTPPATAEPKAPPQPQPTPAQQPQGPPAPSPLALAYFEVARQRFGASLTAEQSEAVKRDLEGNVRTAERLRASKLKNSDEPDFVFEA